MERIILHKRITGLLRRHHLLGIATTVDGKPWCASCFYAWNRENNYLVITTDPETKHGSGFRMNPAVAGTIALETKRVGRIRGIQFTGIVFEPEGDEIKQARKCYISRFPYAAMAKLDFWIIKPDFIKLTDNRLGFGKKIIWTATE